MENSCFWKNSNSLLNKVNDLDSTEPTNNQQEVVQSWTLPEEQAQPGHQNHHYSRPWDHDIVLTDSRIKATELRLIAKKINIRKKKADFDSIREGIRAFSTNFGKVSESRSAKQQWKSNYQRPITTMERYVPTKTSSTKHHQPWINNKLKGQSRANTEHGDVPKQALRPRTGYDLRPSRQRSEGKWTGLPEVRKRHHCRRHNKQPMACSQSKRFDTAGISSGLLTSYGLSLAKAEPRKTFSMTSSSMSLQGETTTTCPWLKRAPIQSWSAKMDVNPRKAARPDGVPCRLLQAAAMNLHHPGTTVKQLPCDRPCPPTMETPAGPTHFQEGSQEPGSWLSTHLPDMYMLQTAGAHRAIGDHKTPTPQRHHHWC